MPDKTMPALPAESAGAAVPQDIHAALNAIMKEVGYVQKTSSPSLRYTYAGERNLIAACRPAMVRWGVYMSVIELQLLERERYTTERGTPMVSTSLLGKVRFTHAPSQTWIDVMVTGEGSDSGDKSYNKAMTGLYKYAIRQTLMIETGDDPDQFASEVLARARAAQARSQPPAGGAPRPAAGDSDGAAHLPQKSAELVEYAWRTLGIGGENRELAKRAVGMVYHRLKIAAPSEERWDEILSALQQVKAELAESAA
ncbi:MAG: ERF family protein [Chloroflexota bacterium]